MKKLLLLALLLSTPALAQQPATPSQMAIQIDNIINQWALTVESQQKQIEDLQKEIVVLKNKCGDLCKPGVKPEGQK